MLAGGMGITRGIAGRTLRLGLAWACVALLGCAGEPAELLVDVRTDAVPGRDFSAVRCELDVDTRPRRRDHVVDRERDYVAGTRVAEFGGLAAGTHELRVTLLSPAGEPVLSRPVVVTMRGRTLVTVVLTRDCRAGTTRCRTPRRATASS